MAGRAQNTPDSTVESVQDEKGPQKTEDQANRRRRITSALVGGVLVWLLLFPTLLGRETTQAKKTGLDNVTAAIEAGRVKSAVLDDTSREIVVDLKNGEKWTSGYVAEYGDDLVEILRANKVALEVDPVTKPNMLTGVLLGSVLPIVLIGAVFYLVSRKMSGAGLKNSIIGGKDRITEIPEQRFADVAGCDEAVEDLREVVNFLQDPERYTKLGAQVPRGLLLVGPPGTGKTMLARAVAGEAGVPFFAMSGSDFVELFVGVGASRVRSLFDKARKAGRAIVFIDEIDAIGKARGGGVVAGSNDERENTLNALLVEMDGFVESGVVVVAATNRVDVLDSALLRPGRFDRRVIVGLPDKKGRTGLFRMYLEKAVCEPGLDVEHLSESLGRRSVGMSGADVRAVINEAALGAAKRGGAGITANDANDALERVALGRERRSVDMSEKAQRITAWHESGHALCALLTEGANTPERVSIVPRGGAGGATWFAEADDEHFITRTQARASMVVAFGGRAAEEILLDGDFTQGAAGDIAQATSIAERMVCEWGMSELGLVHINRDRPFEMSEQARVEVRRLVAVALDKAREILQKERDTLEQIAEMLLEQETLSREELSFVVGHRSNLEKP